MFSFICHICTFPKVSPSTPACLLPNLTKFCLKSKEVRPKTGYSLKNLSSVQFSHSVVSDSVIPWTAAHQASLSITNSWSLLKVTSIESVMPSTTSSTVVPFFCCLQSFLAWGSFPMSQLLAWGGQSIGVSASASVLPMNTQDWSLLGWIGLISLHSKGLSRVFSNTTIQKHQFFGAQFSL